MTPAPTDQPPGRPRRSPGRPSEGAGDGGGRCPWTGRPSWRAVGSWPVRLPIVLAILQVGGTLGAAHNQPDTKPVDALAIVLLLLGPAALVFRRARPVAVLYFVMTVSFAYILLGYPYGPFFVSAIVALFEAVRYGHRWAAWLTAGAVYFGHIAYRWTSGEGPGTVAAIVVAGWLLAVLIGSELNRIREERVKESRRAKAAEAAGRVSEERLRIARELHDVVAHNISLINVQAGVALHLMDAQPEQARTALTAIKQASKEALVELRSVLGVLRQVDEPGPRQPAPSLRRLTELAARTRAAGLDVRVEVEGTPEPLPSSVDTAAYRIVQEALTNVLRHAGARSAVVRVAYADTAVTVEVTDDGCGTPSGGGDELGGGSGLPGMRERVGALGGRLHVGPLPGGGFRVYAELPREGAP
ncbi:sensor histidine kinase [Actinopolymorpha singaporensis]|uniref:sensor histidine kinase n=1 Tax=Actinopolymorpha singaporensis TaxID=117157 RepID=UPI000B889B37|nr:sensor histidine kinase [Actinopolymorpha singaporensis]